MLCKTVANLNYQRNESKHSSLGRGVPEAETFFHKLFVISVRPLFRFWNFIDGLWKVKSKYQC